MLLRELVDENLLFFGFGKDLYIFRLSLLKLRLSWMWLLSRLFENSFLKLLERVGIVSVINVAAAS